MHLQTQQHGKLGIAEMTMKIIRSDGIRGLYNGISASLLRQVPVWKVTYLAFSYFVFNSSFVVFIIFIIPFLVTCISHLFRADAVSVLKHTVQIAAGLFMYQGKFASFLSKRYCLTNVTTQCLPYLRASNLSGSVRDKNCSPITLYDSKCLWNHYRHVLIGFFFQK